MARKRISEYRAKSLLLKSLGQDYNGFSLSAKSKQTEDLDTSKTYVVKVDEGVKKRMKKGLVALDKSPDDILTEIKKYSEKGYSHFIVEPFIPHEESQEKYVSIERTREGLQILYSQKGGIDIEENQKDILRKILDNIENAGEIASELDLSEDTLAKLLDAFNAYHFSFLEINPYVLQNGNYYFLDVACEVDSAGEFFVKSAWNDSDFRGGGVREKTEEEIETETLSLKSQASFKLELLNPNGAIFMLLSGGGASIVLADEVDNLGFGKELANYGEYSGNPNAEEVYIYTKNLLKLLSKSKAAKKVLVIGGGVANFTDIRITFQGIIKALQEAKDELKSQHVKVYVRRGGPHQEEGLELMEKFLKEQDLYGLVSDQKTPLPEIINISVKELH